MLICVQSTTLNCLHKKNVKTSSDWAVNQRVVSCSLQVKRPLRPPQQQQPPPPSLEASRTTALPGQSTTVSRPLTTAQPTLRQWVQHHKPLRYTPDKNLPSTSTEYSILLCPNPLGSSGLQGSSDCSSYTNLTTTISSLHRLLAFYVGSPLFLLLTCNVSSMYFFAQGQ